MPIQIRNTRPASQVSEPARQGFTMLFLSGVIGLVIARYFMSTKSKSTPKGA